MARVTGTREWAKYNENVIKGCSHDCWYCYAKEMAVRFKRKTVETWKDMEPVKLLEAEVKKRDGRIMFPTTHDITPETLDVCMDFMLFNLRLGNELLVVSKPHLNCIKLITDRCMEYKDQILFRFTIGSPHNEVLKMWEPGAPSLVERLAALEVAFNKGYATSVSCEPMLSSNEDMLLLVRIMNPIVTDSIWLGKMNKVRNRLSVNGAPDDILKAADKLMEGQSDDLIIELYDTLKDNPKIKWKDSIKEVVGLPSQDEAGQDT